MPKKKIPGNNSGEKIPEKIYDFRNNFETGTIRNFLIRGFRVLIRKPRIKISLTIRVDIFNILDLHIISKLHLKYLITRLFDSIFT